MYLAGPEVFHPHRGRIFEERCAVCARLGFEALVPLDERATTAASIYRSNLRLLAGADAVVANLSPFRGLHADPGTAWEIGHAVARDTPDVPRRQPDGHPHVARGRTHAGVDLGRRNLRRYR